MRRSLLTELINAIKGYLAQAPPIVSEFTVLISLDENKLKDPAQKIYPRHFRQALETIYLHPYVLELFKDSSLKPLMGALEHSEHKGMLDFMRDRNHLYPERTSPL